MDREIVSKHYFKEIFRSFLIMSILPFLIFTSSIIFIYHSQKKIDISHRLKQRNIQTVKQIESLADEYIQIINIVDNHLTAQGLKEVALSESVNELYELINPYQAGKTEKIAIHIIGKGQDFNLSTSTIPKQYINHEFRDWGIMYYLNLNEEVVIYPSLVKTDDNEVSFSVGKTIFDKSHQPVGFLIIDIYREYLITQFSEHTTLENTVLYDSEGVIVVNTQNPLSEGKHISVLNQMDTLEGHTLFTQDIDSTNLLYSITSMVSIKNFSSDTISLINIFLLLIVVMVIINAYVTKLQAKKIYRPIESIMTTMRKVEKNPSIRMDEKTEHEEIKYIAFEFNRMLDKIEELNKEVVEKSERENIAEMKALQAQISPHFLYNMLNEIKSLAKLGRTEDVSLFIQHLGTMLRRSIDNAEKSVTLQNDLEFIKSYLELQKIRYENSFDYFIIIDEESKKIKIPNLILQPLIENSILHGFSSLREDQILKITTTVNAENLQIEIYDNGRGLSEEQVGYINDKFDKYAMYGNHGLENVQKRLIMTYGLEYGITVESEISHFTRIKILIPIGDE